MKIKHDKITIYSYGLNEDNQEVCIDDKEVNAVCLGGKTGIFAMYTNPENPKEVSLASGDDGHWECIGTLNKVWIPHMIDLFKEMLNEN